jgi:hypothetical protein
MASAQPWERVFVIQLSSDADLYHDCMAGRVEHVESGLSVRFASTEEMREFMARILREVADPQASRGGEKTAGNR